MERVFGGPFKPVTEHLRARTTEARRETKAEKTGRLLKESSETQHYKIVSISLYMEDIERLNSMVDELKSRGHFKANKSMLIHHALEQLDLIRSPRIVDSSTLRSTPAPHPKSMSSAIGDSISLKCWLVSYVSYASVCVITGTEPSGSGST